MVGNMQIALPCYIASFCSDVDECSPLGLEDQHLSPGNLARNYGFCVIRKGENIEILSSLEYDVFILS